MKNLYVDDYFSIGHMHLISGKPCQDYSFSGNCGETAFAIVSDGCSTGRHTDVGSRIVALSTVNAIKMWSSSGQSIDRLSQLVSDQHYYAIIKSGEAFNLQTSDLLATCMYACLRPNGGLLSIQGDGVIAKVYRDGSVKLNSYQWDDNTPLYPAYRLDNYGSFILAHGGDISLKPLRVECHHYQACGSVRVSSRTISLDEAIKGVTDQISEDEIEKLSFIALFSDGVMQVDGMDWKDAVLKLLAFKSLEGDFAKRRMIKFIKDSRDSGNKKGPLDDISYSVIRIGHEIREDL